MSTKLLLGCTVVALAAAVNVPAQAAGVTGTTTTHQGVVQTTQPVYTQAMQALRDSAQKLRESIQQLAQKPPGPDRAAALHEARAALLRTQEAMLDLPPQDRVAGTVASTAGYDASVKKLMAASDSLRNSVQEMATLPAGPRRNDAIRAANRALLDTQSAMANAYDLTAYAPQATVTVTTSSLECVHLPNMTACH